MFRHPSVKTIIFGVILSVSSLAAVLVGRHIKIQTQTIKQEIEQAGNPKFQTTEASQLPAAVQKQKDKNGVGSLRDWPNDAEMNNEERWMVCCDQMGHFYAKLSNNIVNFANMMSADGKTYIKSKYCFTNDKLENDTKPTMVDCMRVMALTKNLDNKSMYE